MNELESKFTRKCLKAMKSIFSCPEKLSLCIQAFTKGDNSHRRYQCQSKLVDSNSFSPRELTAFTAAYFEAIFQTLEYFQKDTQIDIVQLNHAQLFFEKQYIPILTSRRQGSEAVSAVLDNISSLLKSIPKQSLEDGYEFIHKDEAGEGNPHQFFSGKKATLLAISAMAAAALFL